MKREFLTLAMPGRKPVTVRVRCDERRKATVVAALAKLGGFAEHTAAVEYAEDYGDNGAWLSKEGIVTVYEPAPSRRRKVGEWRVRLAETDRRAAAR